MKKLKNVIVILLNVLFCAIMLWFLTGNAYLRSYAGFFKEFFLGILLIGTLYINYFLLYPKIHQKKSRGLYWLTLVLIASITGFIDLAIAYPNIMACNAAVIKIVGYYNFFLRSLFFIIGRNLALNFFPYQFREQQHLKQSLENEVRAVYQSVRKIDVTDKDNNIHLIDIDKIFYCLQQGNFTEVHTVQNKNYTRLGSMKHLEQLLGEEDFIRITRTVLVPFRYTKSCKDNMLIMKKMPWKKEPTTFQLEPKTQKETAKRVIEGILKYRTMASGKRAPGKTVRPKVKRKPITPPDEKIKKVFSFIEKHSNCNTGDIIAETGFSSSTVERCLYELRKQGLIKHSGSKKKGGYTITQQKTLTEE